MCVVLQHNLGKGVRAAPVASPCIPAHSGIEPFFAGRVRARPLPREPPPLTLRRLQSTPLGPAFSRDAWALTGGGSPRAAPHTPHDQGDFAPLWNPRPEGERDSSLLRIPPSPTLRMGCAQPNLNQVELRLVLAPSPSSTSRVFPLHP